MLFKRDGSNNVNKLGTHLSHSKSRHKKTRHNGLVLKFL